MNLRKCSATFILLKIKNIIYSITNNPIITIFILKTFLLTSALFFSVKYSFDIGFLSFINFQISSDTNKIIRLNINKFACNVTSLKTLARTIIANRPKIKYGESSIFNISINNKMDKIRIIINLQIIISSILLLSIFFRTRYIYPAQQNILKNFQQFIPFGL